jgi:prevent-host-death family protein
MRYMRTIAQRQLRNDNAAIVDAVSRGETFIVTRNGVPVAELRPAGAGRHRFVRKTDLTEAALEGPPLDAARFRADLNGSIDQSLSS